MFVLESRIFSLYSSQIDFTIFTLTVMFPSYTWLLHVCQAAWPDNRDDLNDTGKM